MRIDPCAFDRPAVVPLEPRALLGEAEHRDAGGALFQHQLGPGLVAAGSPRRLPPIQPQWDRRPSLRDGLATPVLTLVGFGTMSAAFAASGMPEPCVAAATCGAAVLAMAEVGGRGSPEAHCWAALGQSSTKVACIQFVLRGVAVGVGLGVARGVAQVDVRAAAAAGLIAAVAMHRLVQVDERLMLRAMLLAHRRRSAAAADS